jgi:SAM-dependent methyltransferase
LWDAEVHNAEAAARRIHEFLVSQFNTLEQTPPTRVIDLGCGVGGTLFHLADVWPQAELHGITLSPKQASVAQQLATERRVAERLTVTCGDFLSTTLAPADCVIAIESHVHAPSPDDFLAAAVRGLNPGGVLLLVDDFLRYPEPTLDRQSQRLIQQFRSGWRLGHLGTSNAFLEAAARYDLNPLTTVDYSQFIKLNRWRDHLLRYLAPGLAALSAARWPFYANMIGGNALTQAYRRGLMQYQLLVLQRADTSIRPTPDSGNVQA